MVIKLMMMGAANTAALIWLRRIGSDPRPIQTIVRRVKSGSCTALGAKTTSGARGYMTDNTKLMDMLSILTAGGRLNPEKSRAQPWRMYRNPEEHVKLGGKKEVVVERISDREKADTLLIEWYRWSKAWRPNLGAPRISPSCRGYRGDEKHNDEGDGYDSVYQKEMKAVDFCVGSIAVPMQQAIGTELRNREAKARVWRDHSNHTFEQALSAVMPLMRKHEDLVALF